MSPAFEYLSHKLIVDANGCWLWQGSQDGKGYGRLRSRKAPRNRFTHRVAYEMDRGPIPDGLVIDHLCKVTICCNPDHLEPVTNSVNVKRGAGVHFRPDGMCMAGLHDITQPGAIKVINNAHWHNKQVCLECYRATGRRNAARQRAKKKLSEGAKNA